MVVATRDAAAFCRTTTMPVPAGFDPTVDGCWTQGSDIAWLWDQHVGYQLDAAASRQISLADATRAADQAFARWNDVVCPGGQAPNVTAVDNGPVSAATVAAECGSTPCDPSLPGAYHLVVFRDDGWEYDDPANTLALTTVTYEVDSAVLFNAEIEINSHDHMLTTTEPPPPGSFDLQTILTHEAGHFLGLAHATKETSVMYAYYSDDARELSNDDIAGICAAYPPAASQNAGVSCALGAQGGPGGEERGGALLGAGAALLALVWVRRRR
jgi:hypothetical protein